MGYYLSQNACCRFVSLFLQLFALLRSLTATRLHLLTAMRSVKPALRDAPSLALPLRPTLPSLPFAALCARRPSQPCAA